MTTDREFTRTSLKDVITRLVLIALLPWLFLLALIAEIRRRVPGLFLALRPRHGAKKRATT